MNKDETDFTESDAEIIFVYSDEDDEDDEGEEQEDD